MKKNLLNRVHLEGLLYQHTLEEKVTGDNSANPGTKYISGNIEIATDDAITNIVPVHFTYVTAVTAKGNANATYTTLMNIINGTHGSVMGHGADKAVKLRVDTAIGLNEFYSDRNGTEELVSVKRNEGGFVHIASELNENVDSRNLFDVDMIITNVSLKEANDELNLPEKAIVKGAIFDFKKSLLPVEFSAVHPSAINYFLGLEASPKNPVFTKLQGKQISEVIITRKEEESAFGAPMVREVKSTRKDFVITWAQPNPYEWDSEDTILASELKEAMTARETYLATVKKRNDEYKASKAKKATVTPATGGFNF